MVSSSLDYICLDPLPKAACVQRYQGLGLQDILGGYDSTHNNDPSGGLPHWIVNS